MSRSWFGRRDRGAGGGTPSGGSGGAAGEPVQAPADAGVAGGAAGAGGWGAGSGGTVPLRTIDALGRKCPIPIIMLAEQIRDVPVGAVIAVLADDPAAYADIPSWCGMKSHELVYRDALESGWTFGIRRRY